ncbi:MAG: ribonuclease HIII [Victivallales bacterium]|jgi:ribonuclease HIII|nr:ribonuclease HIII [Victivallales bacterium]
MADSKKVTSFVCTITEAQAEELRVLLDVRGWTFSEQPYAFFKASHEKINVVAYRSGKLTVQGANTEEFVTFTLEPEILHEFSFGYESESAEESFDPHGGVDESGKGDFFGPLCIAGVYVDARTAPELRKIGCCDSKLIKSSKKIMELAIKIREIVGDGYTVVTLPPEAYNRLYAQIGNLNRMLAWGHARVIENLLEKVPACPRMLSDKFANENLIKRALMSRGRKIQLDQRTKAESDVAVAAASILSREQFLRGMAKLSTEFGTELPRGAGTQVKVTGRTLFERYGASVFTRCAKLHFKTFSELTTEKKI